MRPHGCFHGWCWNFQCLGVDHLLRWIDAMKQQEHDLDLIAIQELAMRSVEENWRYGQENHDGCKLVWNQAAPHDRAIVISAQLTSRAREVRSRATRHAFIVSFRIERQQYAMVNVHVPSWWATQKAYEEALGGGIADKMQELVTDPGCTITMMGDQHCEWSNEMATHVRMRSGAGQPRDGSLRAAALAAFAAAWKNSPCQRAPPHVRSVLTREVDLD